MDRIALLIQKIQEAHNNSAEVAILLPLVQELQSALFEQSLTVEKKGKRVAVMMPSSSVFSVIQAPAVPIELPVEEEKVIEVLQVDEQALEQELNEIKEKAAFANQMQVKPVHTTPGLLFEWNDDIQELPTFVHQPRTEQPTPPSQTESISSDATLNDQLASHQKEVSDQLSHAPIKELRKAIGINDRFVFINELFRGDENMYERSVKTIDNFTNYAEAQYWMERELKVKLGWDNEKPFTQDFYGLVKRRFA
jgi:hypothetical protein